MNIVEVKIKEKKESSYPIIIGGGLLNNAYDYIEKYTKADRYLLITNNTVFDLYGNKLKSDNTEFVVLPDGEKYKNMETIIKITDKALQIKLERKDAIIALGGGVIGDMAGFAASMYLRGVDFIQIPTTLLAQVDSSVGGKVGVNHALGKNMLGAFYQPKLVLADTNTLDTLDTRQFKTGLSEVIKYAFIEKNCTSNKNYSFLEFLQNNRSKIFNKNHKTLSELITICCELKSSIVSRDETEKGYRAILNLGHTYAHAIEKITHYEKYTHGEAVSIGLKLIFDLALNLNKITGEYHNEAIKLLNDYELITKLDFKPDRKEFYEAMKSDKKVKDKNIVFIMPKNKKEAEIYANCDKNLILRGI